MINELIPKYKNIMDDNDYIDIIVCHTNIINTHIYKQHDIRSHIDTLVNHINKYECYDILQSVSNFIMKIPLNCETVKLIFESDKLFDCLKKNIDIYLGSYLSSYCDELQIKTLHIFRNLDVNKLSKHHNQHILFSQLIDDVNFWNYFHEMKQKYQICFHYLIFADIMNKHDNLVYMYDPDIHWDNNNFVRVLLNICAYFDKNDKVNNKKSIILDLLEYYDLNVNNFIESFNVLVNKKKDHLYNSKIIKILSKYFYEKYELDVNLLVLSNHINQFHDKSLDEMLLKKIIDKKTINKLVESICDNVINFKILKSLNIKKITYEKYISLKQIYALNDIECVNTKLILMPCDNVNLLNKVKCNVINMIDSSILLENIIDDMKVLVFPSITTTELLLELFKHKNVFENNDYIQKYYDIVFNMKLSDENINNVLDFTNTLLEHNMVKILNPYAIPYKIFKLIEGCDIVEIDNNLLINSLNTYNLYSYFKYLYRKNYLNNNIIVNVLHNFYNNCEEILEYLDLEKLKPDDKKTLLKNIEECCIDIEDFIRILGKILCIDDFKDNDYCLLKKFLKYDNCNVVFNHLIINDSICRIDILNVLNFLINDYDEEFELLCDNQHISYDDIMLDNHKYFLRLCRDNNINTGKLYKFFEYLDFDADDYAAHHYMFIKRVVQEDNSDVFKMLIEQNCMPECYQIVNSGIYDCPDILCYIRIHSIYDNDDDDNDSVFSSNDPYHVITHIFEQDYYDDDNYDDYDNDHNGVNDISSSSNYNGPSFYNPKNKMTRELLDNFFCENNHTDNNECFICLENILSYANVYKMPCCKKIMCINCGNKSINVQEAKCACCRHVFEE